MIGILQNRKRLETDKYDEGRPIVKESILNLLHFPKRPLRQDFEISETLIEHEDNLFMSIESVTTQESTAFQLDLEHSIDKIFDPRTRYLI